MNAIVGAIFLSTGVLIEILARMENTLYWSNTTNFYFRDPFYNVSFFFIGLGVCFFFVEWKKTRMKAKK